MSDKRIERVAHQIRDEISTYLQRGLLKDPRIGFVTISGVRVSKDLRHAKVFASVFGSPEEGQASIEALQHAQGFLRRTLGKNLRIRRVPELTFILDSSIEQGIRVAQMLQELPENQTDEYDEFDEAEAEELDAPRAAAAAVDEPEIAASMPTDWAPLLDAIHKGERFLVAAHREPDGDAVGSTTALCGVLSALGKEVVLFNDGPYPQQFLFLPYADKMVTDLSNEAPFDVSILCDCGEVSRAPEGFPTTPEQRGTFLVIDHHLTSRLEGDHNYNDPMAPAVGSLIYDLAQELKVTIDKAMATSMYCAILSDTGGFRYQKTTPKTFRVAAELLEAGVSPWEVASGLFESSPLQRQKLLARALDSLELRVNGSVAFMTITKQMCDEVGASASMTDGFINFGRGVSGVEVAVLFREEEEMWKVSFRSRGKVNVAAIAAPLGGGGHHNAAGAKFAGDLAHLKQMITEQVEQVFQDQVEPPAET